MPYLTLKQAKYPTKRLDGKIRCLTNKIGDNFCGLRSGEHVQWHKIRILNIVFCGGRGNDVSGHII